MVIQFDEEKQKKRLDELRKKEEEDLAQMLSQRYGVPYLDLSKISINTNALRLIPEDRARSAMIAIFDRTADKLKVAILSPSRESSQNEIKELERRNFEIETYIVSTQSLERAWKFYEDISSATITESGSLDISDEQIQNLIAQVKSIPDIQKIMEDVMGKEKSFRISRIVETILAGGIGISASDIHIEPEEDAVRIRYRLDGVLTEVSEIDPETHRSLVSRIKILAGMKLNINKQAQDGRFSVNIDTNEIEIRTSILPGAYGESIVMRILNPESIKVEIEQLGMSERMMEVLSHEVNKPNGLILNTGPTGSGKTTTLYAFLRKKNKPGIKIITIEDPIEYHLSGIVQTQVDRKKDYTFASGLRASLRQDPDVIMVGEIRDQETAEIAIHSALTGHLVYSTLHTNNAAGAFPRLIDMGINPKIIPSALNVAIAQRLVRKLCPHCRKEVPIPEDRMQIVKENFESMPYNDLEKIPDHIYEAGGCDKCGGIGYKGRLGIFEAVLSDKNVEQVLQKSTSERDILEAARAQEIPNMKEDGINKVLKGVTTFEELDRVIEL